MSYNKLPEGYSIFALMTLFQELSTWRELFMAYGCSAHALNLVESSATPACILSSIVAISKYFRDHHEPAALLKEQGGLIPQLPNSTRWVRNSPSQVKR